MAVHNFRLLSTMAKQSYPSTRNADTLPIDCKKCILCQSDINEVTRCPAKSSRKNKEIGYRTLAGNLLAFNVLESMPMDINVQV